MKSVNVIVDTKRNKKQFWICEKRGIMINTIEKLYQYVIKEGSGV